MMKLIVFQQEEVFDNLLEVDDKCSIGSTNEPSPYSMLIDAFRDMTNHLEGHCTIEEINEIRLYLTNKVTKCKKNTRKH